jgi:hypothetical protein
MLGDILESQGFSRDATFAEIGAQLGMIIPPKIVFSGAIPYGERTIRQVMEEEFMFRPRMYNVDLRPRAVEEDLYSEPEVELPKNSQNKF